MAVQIIRKDWTGVTREERAAAKAANREPETTSLPRILVRDPDVKNVAVNVYSWRMVDVLVAFAEGSKQGPGQARASRLRTLAQDAFGPRVDRGGDRVDDGSVL